MRTDRLDALHELITVHRDERKFNPLWPQEVIKVASESVKNGRVPVISSAAMVDRFPGISLAEYWEK